MLWRVMYYKSILPLTCTSHRLSELLTHWGRGTHICFSKLTTIGSDNGLSPIQYKAIIWTNAGILMIRPLGRNCSENWVKIHKFSYKMHSKMSSVKWQPFCLSLSVLTRWGRVTHICIGNLTIIGSDNGLSPGRRQAITWTNVGLLLIGPLETNFSEMLIQIHTFLFRKIDLKMSSGKWWPFCFGLSVLKQCSHVVLCAVYTQMHLCISV